MDSTSTILLIVAIVSVAIGYAAGALITSNRARKDAGKQASQSTETPAKAEPAATQPADMAPAAMPAPVETASPAVGAPPVDPNRVDIAALWRELPHGELRADMSGKTIRKSGDLTSDQRNLLGSLMADMQDWIGAPKPAVETKAAPAAATAPAAPPVAPTPKPVPPLASEKPVETPVVMEGAPALEEEPIKHAPTSIVGQIDEILQAQIKGTPLESRGIRLTESPTHGVTVWIGIKAFQGMDTIPDEAVNAAIRTAVKQWESQK